MKKEVHIKVKGAARTGVGFGMTLAMVISYTAWQSIG